MRSKWRAWVEDRFGLDEIKHAVLKRPVPETAWYHGDGATLALLLMVLVVTGMFMTPTYAPDPDRAYQSVQYITHEQVMGWFIRGLHYWSAGLMVVMLFFHLFRQLLMGGYKPPREGTYLIGVVMFFLVLIMAWSGYVLRWDERAIYALRVALHMLYNVPWIGEELVVFVQGGYEMGARTLTRMYALHAIFVPALLVGLTGFHVYLVIIRGVISPAEREQPVQTAEEQKELYHEVEQDPEQSELFHPATTAKSGGMALAVFVIAVGLTLFWGPAGLQPEANLTERAFPAEEWYFWWYSGLIALLPHWLAPTFVVVFPILVFVVLAALPFVDRSPYRGVKHRPIALALVVVMVVGLLYLTDLRRRSPWTGWPRTEPPAVPADVTLTPEAEQGRQIFAAQGCNSCHSVAGDGAGVAPDLAQIDELYSFEQMRSWVLDPPDEIPMPSYRDRIAEDELDLLIEYLMVVQTFPREGREVAP